MIVTYNPDLPVAVADGRVNAFVDNLMIHRPDEIEVCNESVIDEIRLRVCEGKLKHDEVSFVYEGKIVRINEYGRFDTPLPKGFGDTNLSRLEGLLTCAVKLHKKKEKKL